MSLQRVRWLAKCDFANGSCEATATSPFEQGEAMLELRKNGWRFSVKRGPDAYDLCPRHASDKQPKYFQGPGTGGHPTDCSCAACRNFDD